MHFWHLDGWDRLGGRAFATQRESGKDLTEFSDTNGPTVYLGPPGFQPEVLASPSVALSACRNGAFESRVPPNENAPEVAFPTVDAVAEFVRRGFISGGRGRGGGGGTGEGPPLPREPNDGEPREGPTVEGTSPLQQYSKLHAHARKFLESPIITEHGPSFRDALALSELKPGKGYAPVRHYSVSAGAAILAVSLLDAHAAYRGTLEGLRQWRHTALHLRLAITELDLWAEWIDKSKLGRTPRSILSHLSAAAARVLRETPQPGVERRLISLIPILLSDSFDADELSAIRSAYHVGDPLFGELYIGAGNPPHNRYEVLFGWPLPSWLVRTPTDPKTVGDLVSLFAASPIQFERFQPEVFDLLAFAGAFLSSRTTDRAHPAWREAAALAWFERSRPHWAFSADVESLLLNGA